MPGEAKISALHRISAANLHLWLTAALAVALFPSLLHLHLPVKFDWAGLATAYWLVLAAQSIFLAALLCVIGLPWSKSLGPVIQRYRAHPAPALLLMLFIVVLVWATSWMKGLVLGVDTIACLELRERLRPAHRARNAAAILLPALYLFIGFLLVFGYNDIIASLRFFGSTDAAFNAADKWLLRGITVSDICHRAMLAFPLSFFRFLEFIYFEMFPQVGAGLIISSLWGGQKRGLQFAGTILTAYYIALLLYFFWPSQGPYYLCPGHFSRFPQSLAAYAVQKQCIANAQRVWLHLPIGFISKDYYIAFPCMHIVQPLIVVWFLRPWKRMVAVLVAYDVLLVAAIILLEWHYVVDVLAGVPVALCAIAIVDGREAKQWLADLVARKPHARTNLAPLG